MGFKLAEAFVELGWRMNPFRAGLRAAQAQAQQFHGRLNGLLGGVGAGLGLGIGGGIAIGIGAAIKQTVMGASDLNETINKVGVIFGESAQTVIASAGAMADKFGIVKTEWMDSTAEIGNLLQGMGGMSQKAAAEMSRNLAMAAADSSSIFNKSFGDSIGKIASALRGQSEPISEFGVDAQEAATKAEALRIGIGKGSAELTMQQKVAARASLVLRGLKVAEGDLANTQAGFANSSRAVWGRVQNIFAALGQALMPIFEGLMHRLNAVGQAIQAWVDGHRPQIEAFSAAFVAAGESVLWAVGQIGEAIAGLGAKIAETEAYQVTVAALGTAWQRAKDTIVEAVATIGAVWRNWSLIGEEVGIRARMWMLNIVEYTTYLGDAFGTFLEWFARNWKQVFADAFHAVIAGLDNLETNFLDFGTAVYDWIQSGFSKPFEFAFTPLLEGFKATVEKLPEIAAPALTDLQAEIDQVRARMFEGEVQHQDELNAAARAKKPDAAKPGAPAKREVAPEVAAKGKTPKAATEDLGSYIKRLGGAAFDTDVAKQALAVQKQQLAVQKQQLAVQRQAANMPAQAGAPA